MNFPPPEEYNTPSAERRYLFGNRWLNFDEARKHFLIVASTGGGKTINITILLKHVLIHQAKPETSVRAMVYDSKTDLISTIAALIEGAVGKEDEAAVLDKLLIANPFDARCCAWDIARDIEDASMADDVAAILVPETPNSNNPFFTTTARRVLEGIMTAFIDNAPGKWTLRDVIEAAKSKQRLKVLFESSEDTLYLLSFFDSEKTFGDVLSTLTGYLAGYRGIAAAWEMAREAGRKVSLENWLTSDQVIVLGNSTRKKEPIARLNNLLFSEATKILLDKPGKETNGETWFFLDEASELGKMETLGDLMKRGRSKGAAVVLGFQGIGDMDENYGKNGSRTLVGQTYNVAFLHVNDSEDETQRWASKVVGEGQLVRQNRSTSSSSGSSTQPHHYGTSFSSNQSENVSEQVVTEPAVLPSQFGSPDPNTGFPITDAIYGMNGLYRVGGRWVKQHFSADVLFFDDTKHNYVPQGDADRFQDFIPWEKPPRLANWSQDDAERLGIVGLSELLAAEPKASDKSDLAEKQANIRAMMIRRQSQ